MKALIPLILCMFIFSCGSPEKSKTGTKVQEEDSKDINLAYKGPDFELINNCLRTTLSYKLQIEPRDYDSIATYYFHEIRDYADRSIRSKNRTLKVLQANLRDSLPILEESRSKSLEGQIDILQQEINSFSKEVIGFVFVHTFRIKEKDTMSAIYVMDQNCGFKELIKVKAISDPNPEDYIESIRAIER
jgi:hypothetical protein